MDPVVMQAIITRGVQNYYVILENCDAGLFVHSGQAPGQRGQKFQMMTGRSSMIKMGTLVLYLE